MSKLKKILPWGIASIICAIAIVLISAVFFFSAQHSTESTSYFLILTSFLLLFLIISLLAHLKVSKSNKTIRAQYEIKSKELEKFIYIISHDIKAPLRAIENLSGWIEEDSKENIEPNVKEHLTKLKSRVNRITNMMEGLLQYSRVGRLDSEIKEILMEKLLSELKEQYEKENTVLFKFFTEIKSIKTMHIRFNQVLCSLIENAIMHTDKDTTEVTIHITNHQNKILVSVKDNGSGIGEENQERIFDIFQTLVAKDKFETTGIGLTLSKKIVESLNEKIWLKSEPEKGSVFFFTWPKKLKNTPIDEDASA